MKNYYLIAVLIILTACLKPVESHKPENLIPEEKLAYFLADAHIAEADVQLSNILGDSSTQVKVNYYNYLIEKHGFTREQFVESINYYLAHPDEFEKIYERVNEILNTMEEEAQKP